MGKREGRKRKKGTLENVIDELSGFGRKAVAIGAIAAMPLSFLPFAPSHVPRAAVTAYGYAAVYRATANVMQEKPALEKLVKVGTIGAINSVPLAAGFTALNMLEKPWSRFMAD